MDERYEGARHPAIRRLRISHCRGGDKRYNEMLAARRTSGGSSRPRQQISGSSSTSCSNTRSIQRSTRLGPIGSIAPGWAHSVTRRAARPPPWRVSSRSEERRVGEGGEWEG